MQTPWNLLTHVEQQRYIERVRYLVEKRFLVVPSGEDIVSFTRELYERGNLK
jgi:uncharacterized protein YoaH (UPF0181 family)